MHSMCNTLVDIHHVFLVFFLGGWVNSGIMQGLKVVLQWLCVCVCQCVLLWALQVEQSANIKAPKQRSEDEEEREGGGGRS